MLSLTIPLYVHDFSFLKWMLEVLFIGFYSKKYTLTTFVREKSRHQIMQLINPNYPLKKWDQIGKFYWKKIVAKVYLVTLNALICHTMLQKTCSISAFGRTPLMRHLITLFIFSVTSPIPIISRTISLYLLVSNLSLAGGCIA